MKYMLMMHAPRGTGDWQVSQWSPTDLAAHVAFMHGLNRELKESGELVGAEGLAAPGEARLVRAGKHGAPPVTDGPFAALAAASGATLVSNDEHLLGVRDRIGVTVRSSGECWRIVERGA